MSEKVFTELCNRYFVTSKNNTVTPNETFMNVFCPKKDKNIKSEESKDSSNKNYKSKFYKSDMGAKWAEFFIKHSSLKLAVDTSRLKKDLSEFLLESQKIKDIQSYKELKWAKKLFSQTDSRIKSMFAEIREVLADGSSFFRSIGFVFLENMLLEEDLSSLFTLLTVSLPLTTFVTPKDTGLSKLNIKIINHAETMQKYLLEELVVLAEACIVNFERKGVEGKYDNSLLLQNMFNKDKLFDLTVVMLMRTMLYDVAEEKNKRKTQEFCRDGYSEVEINREIFELMAMATKAKLSHYKNDEEYLWYNNKGKENIKVVEKKKDEQTSYSIAYDRRFLENSYLK